MAAAVENRGNKSPSPELPEVSPPPDFDAVFDDPELPHTTNSSAQTEDKILVESCTQTSRTPRISIFLLKNNPTMVHFYTGFENFDHFEYVFKCLGPAALHLTYKSR